MAGELQLGGTTLATHTGSGASAKINLDSGLVFPALGNSAVGTVSESSGTPTGDIIERGSNANGEYVQYADGTMICRPNTFIGSVSSSGGFTATINFPKSFVNTVYSYSFTQSSSHGDENYGRSLAWRYGTNTTSQFTVKVSPDDGVGANAADVSFVSIFIGRWY